MTTPTQALRKAIELDIPVILWGPPGAGKTAAIELIGRELNYHVEVLIGSILDPIDIGGRPLIAGGTEPPEFLQRIEKGLAAGRRGAILFLDELTCTAPAVLAAELTLMQSRRAGPFQLPAATRIVAAANPADQAAAGIDLPAPSANRLLHLEFAPSAEEWSQGIIDGWGRGPDFAWRASREGRQAAMMLSGFVRSRPALLCSVPKTEVEQGRAWPSPRTWETVARIVAVVHDTELRATMIDGAVGEGAGGEFRGWLREADLPDPEDCLREPSRFKIPDRGDLVFALAAAIAACGGSSQFRWEAALQCLARLAREGHADASASAMRQLAASRDEDWKIPSGLLEAWDHLLRETGRLPK